MTVISIFVTVIFDGRCLIPKQRMSRKPYAVSLNYVDDANANLKDRTFKFLFGLFCVYSMSAGVYIGL